MSVVTFAYNPNDFFYASSYNTPSHYECTAWKNTDASFSKCNACYGTTLNTDASNNENIDDDANVNKCSMKYWNDMSSNCFKYQLCKNKALANLANTTQNNYSGSDERYANIKKEYDFAVLHTINIITGIVALSGLTVYYFSK